MNTKYYIQLNSDNSINRPYTNENGFQVPSDCIEVSENLLKEFLIWKNKGYIVYYNDGALSKVHRYITEEYIRELKIKEIKQLLSKTDTTQLLDNRLTVEKRAEFEVYRNNLRESLRGLIAKEVMANEVIIPEVPNYESTE